MLEEVKNQKSKQKNSWLLTVGCWPERGGSDMDFDEIKKPPAGGFFIYQFPVYRLYVMTSLGCLVASMNLLDAKILEL